MTLGGISKLSPINKLIRQLFIYRRNSTVEGEILIRKFMFRVDDVKRSMIGFRKSWSQVKLIQNPINMVFLKIPWPKLSRIQNWTFFKLFITYCMTMQVCNTHLLIGFWFCKCQILFKLVEVAARGFVVDLAQKTSYYFGLENITKTNIGFSWFAHLTHTVCRKLNLSNKWVTVLRV